MNDFIKSSVNFVNIELEKAENAFESSVIAVKNNNFPVAEKYAKIVKNCLYKSMSITKNAKDEYLIVSDPSFGDKINDVGEYIFDNTAAGIFNMFSSKTSATDDDIENNTWRENDGINRTVANANYYYADDAFNYLNIASQTIFEITNDTSIHDEVNTIVNSATNSLKQSRAAANNGDDIYVKNKLDEINSIT